MELIEEIKELKEYKEKTGLTIADLARKIGADDTTVGRWLKGKYIPSLESKYKIKRFLKRVKKSYQTELLQDELIDEPELKGSERYLELVKGVERWARDNNLDRQEPYKQFFNIIQEQGKFSEILREYVGRDDLNLKISLGYYQVQLIVYCLIRGLKLKEYIKDKFESEIKNRKIEAQSPHPNPFITFSTLIVTMTVNADIIKYYRNRNEDEELNKIVSLLSSLKCVADEYDTSLEEALEIAYNRIK